MHIIMKTPIFTLKSAPFGSANIFSPAFFLLLSLLLIPVFAEGKVLNYPGADRQSYFILVDDEGVMRRSDTGDEVSYYGINYTVPFAYSYRALKREGHDLKLAIDRDVYHIARMGMNAFRLHLWDAELADSVGNLIQNDHLDLLDYLIARLEERGIDIILTAQTNFGNGYPERNIDTGAFTYDYDKCRIHDDESAIQAQERYISQLLTHFNPYTGRTLGDDRAIIAWEINNEPCHSGTKQDVTSYIDRMTRAMRSSGYNRPILYNVTHNPGVTSGYYEAADIQGTTYQWYPTGLVAGHARKGNFLPALDDYSIPWEDSIPNYRNKARIVYEFDPADVLYSHLYPAIARTFRSKGFQWITQFAYDPLDIAQYNTEYPTHFLNLVYTPAKALSMMIAAKTASETPRGATYGTYPHNTTFGHTSVSYNPDISIYNAPETFIYTNSTDISPTSPSSLRQIAGHGSSPVVKYDGSGVYFLDVTSHQNIWRLEVMPDITIINDPFSNTSVNDAKVLSTAQSHSLELNLPPLGKHFKVYDTNGQQVATALDGRFDITPGSWLLAPADATPELPELMKEKVAGNIGMGEYVAPQPARKPISLLSARRNDASLDVGMIPEAWDFRFDYRNPSWDLPEYYCLDINSPEARATVVRRYVADKLRLVPDGITPAVIKIAVLNEDADDNNRTLSGLPEGTEIAIVDKNGFTYSSVLSDEADGIYQVGISDLSPRKGIIMPAPYPTMLTRYIPAPDSPLAGWRDIESIQLIIPTSAGQSERILLKEIWME